VRYLLDTNVLVSAILFPEGTPGRAYDAMLTAPVDVVICDYTVAELRKVFRSKFPEQAPRLERFLTDMEPGITVVPTPDSVDVVDIETVRDEKDWPIVRAAVAAEADAVVTGDKDLLHADLIQPHMLTPAQVLHLIG